MARQHATTRPGDAEALLLRSLRERRSWTPFAVHRLMLRSRTDVICRPRRILVPEPVSDSLDLAYLLQLIPDPDGGYVFEYPDLPGCLGQIDALAELPEHAEGARRLWLETAFDRGKPIPLPS
jgi:predicted RNase H-like HicB family nuclease